MGKSYGLDVSIFSPVTKSKSALLNYNCQICLFIKTSFADCVEVCMIHRLKNDVLDFGIVYKTFKNSSYDTAKLNAFPHNLNFFPRENGISQLYIMI